MEVVKMVEWWWWKGALQGLSAGWQWQPAPAPFGAHWDQLPGEGLGLPKLVSGELHQSEEVLGPLCPGLLVLAADSWVTVDTDRGNPNRQHPPRPGRGWGATPRRTRAARAGRGSSYSGGHRVMATWQLCCRLTRGESGQMDSKEFGVV